MKIKLNSSNLSVAVDLISRFHKPGLYPILDFDYCQKKQIDPTHLLATWLEKPEVIVSIQLRGKSLDERNMELFFNKVTNHFPLEKWIINDFWQLAIKLGIGFHIGKEDFQHLTLDERMIVTHYNGIKGTSSHSISDVESLDTFWNYSGFGPIYPTESKISNNNPLGTEILTHAMEITKIPLVAIGGITPINYKNILNAAPVTVAAIHSFAERKNYIQFIEQLQSILSLTGN